MKKILGILILLLTFFLLQKAVPISADTTCMKAQGNNVLCVGYLRCPVGPVGQQDIYCCDPGADAECQNLQTPTQPECTSTSNPGAACHLESDTCTTYYGNVGELGCPQFQRCGTNCSTSTNPLPSLTCLDKDPEFHSLRPYPGSPCIASVSDTATFCGDSLTFTDNITEIYNSATDNCTAPNSSGKVTCTYPVKRSILDIKIDLSDATLPIMGNTEDVPNSQPPTSTTPLKETEKMNEYVSWYLNGVMNRAEDGNTENTVKNIVNFSGPLNKLLPGVLLDAQRIKTIDNVDAKINHNQIVACMESNVPIVGNFLRIGAFTPVNCYAGDDSDAQKVVLRLKSEGLKYAGWDGRLALFNSAVNTIYGLTSFLPTPSITRALLDQYMGQAWNKKTPPLPWSDEDGEPFATEDLYMKAYNEWRGKACVIVPVINKVVCFENIFVPNYYADLYPYIPLSSTEDLPGSAQIATTIPSTAGVTISDVVTSGLVSPTLYFAHMQETTELASQLQNTYLYKGADGLAPGDSVPPQTGASCSIVDVRSNKGDSLFATPITGSVSYTATFTCDFSVPHTSVIFPPPNTDSCDRCILGIKKGCSGSNGETGTQTCVNSENCIGRVNAGNWGGCITTSIPPATQSCTKTIPITLAITTQTPLVNGIWNKLVAGSASVFRRMFPKLGAGSALGEIKDIPASTAVTYSGNAGGTAVNGTGQLNFPHIGGISEYFLKGIQTMLRPKGYGEPISFGETTTSLPPLGEIDCDQSAPDPNLPDTIGREALHALAMNWIGGQEGDRVLECYNDVARKSLAAGISPAFTFFMWLHESGGSNYNISNQDFGINSADVIGFTAQITRFLGLPKGYMNTYPQCFGVGDDTLSYFDLFAVGLQGGLCVHGSENGQNYIDMITTGWNWFTTCPMASFPFKSSCY